MGRIKTRATFYAMGLVLLLITIFTLTIIQDKQKVLEDKTLVHRQLLKNSFELAMLETQKQVMTIASEIAGNNGIVDAFAAGDRETLYRLTLPYFKKAKTRREIDFGAFVGSDGIHLLRMHAPQKYGDDMTHKRPMLAYAIQNKKPVSSIDITLYNPALVTIVPIYKNHRFIGILQLCTGINHIQERLSVHSAIKSTIAFDTLKLKTMLPDSVVRKSYNGFSLVSWNDPLFERLPDTFDFDETKRYMINDRDYIMASLPLYDFQNIPLAKLTCAFDVTRETGEYYVQIRNLLIISLILLSLVGVILHYGFNILIRRIDKDTVNTHQLNEKLRHQLYSDHLTDLPNRNALIRDMSNHRFYALMLLNIDNFKQVNDFYGHSVGDEILLSLSHSLKAILNELPMSLYKMPSDEFAIALTEPITSAQLEAARLTIVHHLQAKHYDLMGASFYITLTMGMDIASKNENLNAINLLLNADMALKSAKKRHLHFLLYDETMQIKQEYQNNIHWSKKVKEAIEEKRFTLYYQPIVDQNNKMVVEYEALVRMVDENGSIILPTFFLPAAKQSHLYPQITQFVIENVFEMVKETPHTFSINLSVDDIFHTPTSEFIFHKLRTSAHPERIIFELLESDGIENYQEVSTFIAKVKEYGCKIAIDDFGTGYSNFAHILRLNVDILKIDGSLIRNIDTDINAQTIVTAVTSFSKRLGLKTVAEFVHSEAVLKKCQELEIDFMQGYYLGEPKPL